MAHYLLHFYKINVMNIKSNVIIVFLFFIPALVFCQDSNSSKTETKLHKFFHPENKTLVANQDSSKSIPSAATAIQAQAITDTTHQTNHSKSAENKLIPNDTGKNFSNQPSPNPALPVQPQENTNSIYRDTRLGSSSPLYNTYKKNDNGAGAVTTNPNKG